MKINGITLVCFTVIMTTGLCQVTRAESELPPFPDHPTEPEQREKPPPLSVPDSTNTNLSCQEGYFPSAFKDVSLDAWAYQAVIELASPQLACFPSVAEP